jgi:hypothetical protein
MRLLPLLLCGCIFQPSKGPVRDDARVSSSPSPKPRAHNARLAWAAWNSDTVLFYCNRRIDDMGNQVGVIGPCHKIKEDDTPHLLVAFTNVNRPETSPPNAGPCNIELEDAVLVPQKKPARALIGGKVLEEWMPDTDGDLFVIETLPSPDGKLLAILRVAVGLGEGERSIEVANARVIPAPACVGTGTAPNTP